MKTWTVQFTLKPCALNLDGASKWRFRSICFYKQGRGDFKMVVKTITTEFILLHQCPWWPNHIEAFYCSILTSFKYNTSNKNRQVRLLDKDRFGSWPCWSNISDGYLYWHKNISNWGHYFDRPFGLNTRTYHGFLTMNKPQIYSNIYSKYIVKMRTFKQLYSSINETITRKIHVHYSTAQRRLCLLKLN